MLEGSDKGLFYKELLYTIEEMEESLAIGDDSKFQVLVHRIKGAVLFASLNEEESRFIIESQINGLDPLYKFVIAKLQNSSIPKSLTLTELVQTIGSEVKQLNISLYCNEDFSELGFILKLRIILRELIKNTLAHSKIPINELNLVIRCSKKNKGYQLSYCESRKHGSTVDDTRPFASEAKSASGDGFGLIDLSALTLVHNIDTSNGFQYYCEI